jgi:hypothetical protein
VAGRDRAAGEVRAQAEPARPASSADAQGSLDALRRRLDAAEEQNRRDDEVAEQMAQQVRRLSEAAEDLRGRTRLAIWLAGGSLALAAGSLIALLVVL